LVPLPWSTRAPKPSFQPLANSGFVLDVNGHKVLALKLPSKIVMEISGNQLDVPESFLTKIKAKINHAPDTEQWFAVTSIENPLLEDHDNLGVLIAHGLTEASGVTVGKSDLMIVGSIRI